MLFQMSNQDESTSGHWLQRVYPYTICGGVLGAISALVSIDWVSFAENRFGWVVFLGVLLWSIGGAVVGTGCGLNIILRKVSGVHHCAICGAVIGAIGAFIIVVCVAFVENRMPPQLLMPFVICAIAGAVVGTGVGFWDSNQVNRNVISWFQRVFKTGLSKVLGSIFAIVFAFEFYQKAETDSYHFQIWKTSKIWEGILSGGWHGVIAVFMVLAFVVLWKLATKDASKT
jgi:hypothetical protein